MPSGQGALLRGKHSSRSEAGRLHGAEGPALVAVALDFALPIDNGGDTEDLTEWGAHVLSTSREHPQGVGGKEELNSCELVVHVSDEAWLRRQDGGMTLWDDMQEMCHVGVQRACCSTPRCCWLDGYAIPHHQWQAVS
eukprot:1790623-Rhodomonas_salina.3